MIYGKDKALEMGRSLLPSTNRRMAKRDKAHFKRLNRRTIRAELNQLCDDPDFYDDSSVDYNETSDRDINMVRNYRRGGDKTAPFERWSEAITKDIDQDSRLTYVKSLLPKNIIGDHAITHIQWKDHFASRTELRLEKDKELNSADKYAKINRDRLTGEQEIEMLRKCVEDGRLHRELNDYVSKHAGFNSVYDTVFSRELNPETGKWERKYVHIYLQYPPGTAHKGVRKLLGMHDVENYRRDIYRANSVPQRVYIDGKAYKNPLYSEGAYRAMRTFLKAVRDNKPIPRNVDKNDWSWYY